MGQPKYTIYKYVRLKDGSWRYCRAARYANQPIKADVVIEEIAKYLDDMIASKRPGKSVL